MSQPEAETLDPDVMNGAAAMLEAHGAERIAYLEHQLRVVLAANKALNRLIAHGIAVKLADQVEAVVQQAVLSAANEG